MKYVKTFSASRLYTTLNIGKFCSSIIDRRYGTLRSRSYGRASIRGASPRVSIAPFNFTPRRSGLHALFFRVPLLLYFTVHSRCHVVSSALVVVRREE